MGPWSTSGANERKAAQLGPLSMEISVNKMTETTDFPGERAEDGPLLVTPLAFFYEFCGYASPLPKHG